MGVGEMFGGSMREWRYEKLSAEIARRKMDLRPLQWFLDLRKSGSAPHGGWGMGFARICMLLTGVPSVRDIVPFPVYYGSKLVRPLNFLGRTVNHNVMFLKCIFVVVVQRLSTGSAGCQRPSHFV